jgi:hypothetical protein
MTCERISSGKRSPGANPAVFSWILVVARGHSAVSMIAALLYVLAQMSRFLSTT